MFALLACAIFIGSIKMYLQLISFLHTDMTQVVGIPPHVRQNLTYPTCRKISNIRRTLVGNKIVDHSDVSLLYKRLDGGHYHVCSYPGDARSQGIINHEIDYDE